MNKLKLTFILLTVLFSAKSFAQIEADPLPGDPRLVVFQYDDNNSFRVYSKPLAATHIQLDRDESVKILAMGDTIGWITGHKENNVFIKPRYPNMSTPATLITNKRTYQFVFRSTSENGRWYQRISFVDPSNIMQIANIEDRNEVYQAQLKTSIQEPVIATKITNNQDENLRTKSANLNFEYDLIGEADFKPTKIYDDGSSTYIQFKTDEDVPALFKLHGKNIELIDFTQKGNTIIIPRIIAAGMLKLGDAEIKFYNSKKIKKNILGDYNFDGIPN